MLGHVKAWPWPLYLPQYTVLSIKMYGYGTLLLMTLTPDERVLDAKWKCNFNCLAAPCTGLGAGPHRVYS